MMFVFFCAAQKELGPFSSGDSRIPTRILGQQNPTGPLPTHPDVFFVFTSKTLRNPRFLGNLFFPLHLLLLVFGQRHWRTTMQLSFALAGCYTSDVLAWQVEKRWAGPRVG